LARLPLTTILLFMLPIVAGMTGALTMPSFFPLRLDLANFFAGSHLDHDPSSRSQLPFWLGWQVWATGTWLISPFFSISSLIFTRMPREEYLMHPILHRKFREVKL
jgi:hypothetical protein